MYRKKLLTAALVSGIAMVTHGVQAGDDFAIVGDTLAEAMTQHQMANTRGANHVIRLVMLRSGKLTMPTPAATEALIAAGSISGAGQDRPAIVGLLR
jgi:hypothetical protein